MNADGTRSSDKISLNVKEFGKRYIQHPNDEIDLCIIPLNQFGKEFENAKVKPYVRYLDFNIIPSTEVWNDFTPIEDILMIGYPSGIWDEANNLPIIRKGITATPLKVDYKNMKEFLIDVE
jgi:hypothetical protein